MINLPSNYEAIPAWLEAMEIKPARPILQDEWDKRGFMAVFSALDRPSDVVIALLQIPMCQRLTFAVQACIKAGKAVEKYMPRPAKAVFQDLLMNVRLMDDKERRERIWSRTSKLLKNKFREDLSNPPVSDQGIAAGIVAFQAALIYCTPFMPLPKAHEAMDLCFRNAWKVKGGETGPKVLQALVPLVNEKYQELLGAAAAARTLPLRTDTSKDSVK